MAGLAIRVIPYLEISSRLYVHRGDRMFRATGQIPVGRSWSAPPMEGNGTDLAGLEAADETASMVKAGVGEAAGAVSSVE